MIPQKVFSQFLVLFFLVTGWLIPKQSFAANTLELLGMDFGAVSSALGGTGTAESASLEGVFKNPASLSSLEGLWTTASVTLGADLGLWSLAGSYSLTNILTFGASIYGLSYGEVIGEIYYNGDLGKLLKTGSFGFGGSVGMPLGKLLQLPIILDFGLTAKFAEEVLVETSVSVLALDFGGIIALKPTIGSIFSAGGALRNFKVSSTVNISGRTIPTTLLLGLAYRGEVEKYFTLKPLVDLELLLAGEISSKLRLGLEMGFFRIFALRVGYQMGSDTRGGSIGTSLRLPLGKTSFQADYSLVPMGDLSTQHHIQFTFSLSGK